MVLLLLTCQQLGGTIWLKRISYSKCQSPFSEPPNKTCPTISDSFLIAVLRFPVTAIFHRSIASLFLDYSARAWPTRTLVTFHQTPAIFNSWKTIINLRTTPSSIIINFTSRKFVETKVQVLEKLSWKFELFWHQRHKQSLTATQCP